jgi:hypothetical protein
MQKLQDYYMQLESGDLPLPIVVRGSSHEERVALARAYVSQRYDVAVSMRLEDAVAAVFQHVRSGPEDTINFSLTQFARTIRLLAGEGRRLAFLCLNAGGNIGEMEACYERLPLLERTEHLALTCDPIVVPGGDTFYCMKKEDALSFMAQTIHDEAIYALQDAAQRMN